MSSTVKVFAIMNMKTRYTPFVAAAALVFGLTACDKAPLENSTAPERDAPFAQTAGQATFGNLIAALNNISVQIDRLNALNDLMIGDINVVNVEDVLNGNNVQALNNALNRNDVTVLTDFLQNSLNNNVVNVNVIRDALNAFNILNNPDILITDVIAINVLSGGDVIVFGQP